MPKRGTHKNEDHISVFSPTLGHLVVFFLCNLRIFQEERGGAIPKAGLSWKRLQVIKYP